MRQKRNMEPFNWVREYNKLLEIMNKQNSYFSGAKFIGVVREFDHYHPDYKQFIEQRNNNGLSTSRKSYFYDILMSYKEDIRKQIINRLYEVAAEMENNFINTSEQPKTIENEASVFFHTLSQEIDNINDGFEINKQQSTAANNTKNPTVFISYSWDDEEHKNWVLNLSKKLFDNGVQVILDKYELVPGSNMIHFMETAIQNSDKVLIIFTKNYKTKAEKREGGVGFEYSILTVDIYKKIKDNNKFIPILKDGEFEESIPVFMQQFIAVDMKDPTKFEEMFNKLLHAIYDKPSFEKPSLGKNPFGSI